MTAIREALESAGHPHQHPRLSDVMTIISRDEFIQILGIKRCGRCRAEKPLAEFYPGDGVGGRRHYCIPCTSAAAAAYKARKREERVA